MSHLWFIIHPRNSDNIFGCADGTVHNLNEYIDFSAVEVLKNVEADSVNAVFTHRLGIVVSEGQLEEFFSLMSWWFAQNFPSAICSELSICTKISLLQRLHYLWMHAWNKVLYCRVASPSKSTGAWKYL